MMFEGNIHLTFKHHKLEIRQIVGDNIRCLRNKAGITQSVLAEKTGLNNDYIGRLERSLENISVDNLVKLAVVFNVDVSNLLIEDWCFSLSQS